MTTISKTNFAKQLRVSDAYIYKIQDQLSFVKIKNKKKKQIDLLGVKTLEFLKRREDSGKTTEIDEPEREPDKPTTQRHSQGNNPSGLSNDNDDDNEPEDPHGKTWYEIQLKKQQIEEKRIKNEQKRGNLIEKNLIELLFGKIYQIDVDQIKTIGIELSPKIIAITNRKNKSYAKTICEIFGTDNKDKQKHIESILNSDEKETKTKIISTCEDLSSNILENVQAEIDNFFNVMTNE